VGAVSEKIVFNSSIPSEENWKFRSTDSNGIKIFICDGISHKRFTAFLTTVELNTSRKRAENPQRGFSMAYSAILERFRTCNAEV
jgi:hypothetical protein